MDSLVPIVEPQQRVVYRRRSCSAHTDSVNENCWVICKLTGTIGMFSFLVLHKMLSRYWNPIACWRLLPAKTLPARQLVACTLWYYGVLHYDKLWTQVPSNITQLSCIQRRMVEPHTSTSTGSPSAAQVVQFEDAVCDNILRRVLLHLPVKDLIGSAAVVCKSWNNAVQCKLPWRRKVHGDLIQMCHHSQVPELDDLSMLQFFKRVYSHNMISNPEFLERLNKRKHPWVRTG